MFSLSLSIALAPPVRMLGQPAAPPSLPAPPPSLPFPVGLGRAAHPALPASHSPPAATPALPETDLAAQPPAGDSTQCFPFSHPSRPSSMSPLRCLRSPALASALAAPALLSLFPAHAVPLPPAASPRPRNCTRAHPGVSREQSPCGVSPVLPAAAPHVLASPVPLRGQALRRQGSAWDTVFRPTPERLSQC